MKQTVKRLIVAIILKTFSKRSLHYLLDRRGTLRLTENSSVFVQPFRSTEAESVTHSEPL